MGSEQGGLSYGLFAVLARCHYPVDIEGYCAFHLPRQQQFTSDVASKPPLFFRGVALGVPKLLHARRY